MSAVPVDVLAVHDRIGRSFGAATMAHHDLMAARAAVAELIEAARDYADVEENAYDCTQRIPARNRLRAALARCGDGQ